MPRVITSARLQAVTAGFQTAFNQVFSAGQTQWQKVASKTSSTSAKEIYGWLADSFKMKQVVGEIQVEGITTQDYELVNLPFHDTKAVSEADLMDDREGVYAPRFAMMGMAASMAYDEIVFDRLSNGFTNKGYDGKAFFHAAHPTGDKAKTTFSNLGTKKFSAANYKAALAAIKTVKNANGLPWGFGSKLVLVCHPSIEMDVRAVLFNERIANGASNELRNSADICVSGLLTNPDAWFLLETGWPMLPILLQERQPIAVTSCNQPNDSYVMLNHQYMFQAYGRYNAGYGIPAMAWGSTGADPA